ncbi:MAG: hypothetical protein LHW60_00645 [Candidatus Cloacimonetes bacterium]|nr:hypothetical protein [Candidatus Cloacimonadota bacterium]
MSRKKVNPKVEPKQSAVSKAPFELPQKYLPWIFIAIIFALLSVIYFPIAYKNMEPKASDITQWQGAAKSIIDYNASHKDRALWTQNMFSGMPSYMISFPNRYPFIESITKITDKLMNWRIFLLFLGGIGMFLLIRQLGMDDFMAFFAAIAFIFSCHWVGLLEIGHNTKFMAMMYVPWVFWGLIYLRQKPGMLSLGLFATFLIAQLRQNHPQISYYLYLFLGMYWIYELILSIKAKKLKDFGIWTLLILLAFGLTALAVMNPYMSTMEYSKHTMRGTEGLDKAYAQGWSFHPKEILGFIVPEFWGGINQNYWGYMPFTQVYNYFGLVVLLFAVLALFSSDRKLSIFLWVSSAFFTLISFGSATPALSDLFLNYLPYFNKFRVPSMSLVILQFNMVILAALGLKTVIENRGNEVWKRRYKIAFWSIGAVYILWLLFAKKFFAGLPFTTAVEQARYQEANALSQLNHLRGVRLDALYKSGFLALMFAAVSMGNAYLHTIEKLKSKVFIILIALICFVDLWPYTGQHLKTLYPLSNRTEQHFSKTNYDEFLLRDKDNYRIYPFNMGQVRPAGEWAYHHQTVDGYSAAKLKRYDDILGLINGNQDRDGEYMRYLRGVLQEEPQELRTPILNMLNAKYFLLPLGIPNDEDLSMCDRVYHDENMVIYENRDVMPRAWFPAEIRLAEESETVLRMLASSDFDPAHTAIVEEKLPISKQPVNAAVRQTIAEMHELEYVYHSENDALLVLSEVYYPAGWKAIVGNQELPIHPVNHVLRGVVVPAGENTLRLVFEPESYSKSSKLSLIGILLTSLLIVVGIVLGIVRRFSNKQNKLDTRTS